MESPSSEATLEHLMEQLGLDDSDDALQAFLATHGPLPATMKIADAPFWNDSQAAFLQEAIAEDAQWAMAVDQLDALLRKRP
ncbi:MAG: DUF2789 domain-containing protein [Granulosicoccus sp.]|nr:DUF2789 domain-containing protein [Granulosicoccus sp.]